MYDALYDDKRMEEADSREMDIASGWRPGCLVIADEDDGEGRMHKTIVGARPYIKTKDLFFDMQMAYAEEERELNDQFAY